MSPQFFAFAWHRTEGLHTDIALEVRYFHSSFLGFQTIKPYILFQRSPGRNEGSSFTAQGLGILVPLISTVVSGHKPYNLRVSSASFIVLLCLSVPADGACPL